MSDSSPRPSDVTQLLVNWSQGDPKALEALTPLVYDELRRLARSYLRRECPDHTLQSTALVHEAYLKMVDQGQVRWQNRAHFFGVAAQIIRGCLLVVLAASFADAVSPEADSTDLRFRLDGLANRKSGISIWESLANAWRRASAASS